MGKLKSLIRNVALTTKLPCEPESYSSPVIEYGLNNEIEIYPMTHTDEILMHNPDSLLSNMAVKNIITSCVPAVKDVDNVYGPDIEALLLAIKIASVDDELEVYNVCPKCYELYNQTKEEDRQKLIDEKKVLIDPQIFLFNARACLESMEKVPSKFIVPIKINDKDTLFINIKPLTLKESTEYELNDFNIKNAIQHFIIDSKNASENADMLSDIDNWKENRKRNNDFNQLLVELDKSVLKMIKSSIDSITYNDELLTDEEDIDDVLSSINRKKFEEIRQCVEDANRSRLNKSIKCKCKCCGFEWTNENLEFNFSNFFGQSS